MNARISASQRASTRALFLQGPEKADLELQSSFWCVSGVQLLQSVGEQVARPIKTQLYQVL